MILNMSGGAAPSGTKVIESNGVYDVKQFANVDVNVQSAPVLLWTNPSPTSEFAAQSVSVPFHAGYLIECRRSTSESETSKNFFVFTGTSYQYCSIGTGYTTYSYALRSVRKYGTTLEFGTGFARSQSDSACIPTRIWGVKFTL